MTDIHSKGQLSSTQKGAIGEMMLAAALTCYSDGQLCCFQPVADDDGIDLLIYNKATRLTLALQVKSRLVIDRTMASGTIQFDVRQATWASNEAGSLACIVMDGLTIKQAWLVPISALPTVASLKKGKYVLTPSRSVASKDKYVSFRVETAQELVRQIVTLTNP